MSRLKILQISVVLLVALNLLTLGWVFLQKKDRHPHHENRRHGGPQSVIIQKLQLNETQQQEYALLIEKHQAAIHEVELERKQDKQALYQLLNEEDTLTKDSILNRLKTYQLAVEKIHFNHFKDIRALCDKEQLILFESLSKELGELFRRKPKRRP